MGQIANQMLVEKNSKLIDGWKIKKEQPVKSKPRKELEAGVHKKSFELNYNGGTIWCEHLDGMGNLEHEVVEKFLNDIPLFSRPSVSSYMIINLDETQITENIMRTVIDGIVGCKKRVRRVAFVGVSKLYKKSFLELQEKTGAICRFLDDYEKAKEWVMS